jgi:hypothetical protein
VIYGYKFTMLSILAMTIAMFSVDFSKIDFVSAQNGNTLGQEGDGNEASQSDETSQETSQNSMCVSGDTTELGCNNLSSEENNRVQEDRNSLNGKIYVVQGPSVTPESRGEATSSANCNSGDSIISGFFSVSEDFNPTFFRAITENLDPESNEYSIFIKAASDGDDYTLIGNAVCFDNP